LFTFDLSLTLSFSPTEGSEMKYDFIETLNFIHLTPV